MPRTFLSALVGLFVSRGTLPPPAKSRRRSATTGPRDRDAYLGRRDLACGIATAAAFGVYGPERRWVIEGHGVDPATVVDNLPYTTYKVVP